MVASAMTFLTEIDRLHLLVVHDLIGRALREDRPLHQHGDFLCEAENDIHVVLEDQARSGLVKRSLRVEEEMALRRRHARRRLVEQQHARLLRKSYGNLPHALAGIKTLDTQSERR